MGVFTGAHRDRDEGKLRFERVQDVGGLFHAPHRQDDDERKSRKGGDHEHIEFRHA
jgi:hypothetical protein